MIKVDSSDYSQLNVHYSLFRINDDSLHTGGHYNMDDQPPETTPNGRSVLVAIPLASRRTGYSFSPNRYSERLKIKKPMMKMRTAVINVRSKAKGSIEAGPFPPTVPHKTVR